MAVFTFPDPQGMEWQDWVDTSMGLNPGLIGQLDPNLSWQEFGDRLSLPLADTPYAADFGSWQEWVLALRNALSR
jgi:hypothetical protein